MTVCSIIGGQTTLPIGSKLGTRILVYPSSVLVKFTSTSEDSVAAKTAVGSYDIGVRMTSHTHLHTQSFIHRMEIGSYMLVAWHSW